jgi:hypothetical protein
MDDQPIFGELAFVEMLLHDTFKWESYANEKDLIEAIKAYAAAQIANVKTNDANKAIQACAQFSCAVVSAKDAEIAELTRKIELQDTMHANAEAVLKEENKRLREGIRQALKYIEGPHHSNPEPIAIYEILQSLLSPSDGDGVEENKCQNCSNGQCSNPPSYAVCQNCSNEIQ